MRNMRHLVFGVLFVVAVALTPSAVFADACDVPSGYPTIQAAVDEFTCTEIFIAAGRFHGDVSIDRTVEITGAGSGSTTVLGKVTVEGLGTSAALTGLKIEVSPEGLPNHGLVVVGLAETLPDDLVIGSSMLFSDGFEGGDTTRWSESDRQADWHQSIRHPFDRGAYRLLHPEQTITGFEVVGKHEAGESEDRDTDLGIRDIHPAAGDGNS